MEGLYKGSVMKTDDGVVRRLPVKGADGSFDLIEIDGIFYLEAQGENTLATAWKKFVKSSEFNSLFPSRTSFKPLDINRNFLILNF
jgi:hypothetical protein